MTKTDILIVGTGIAGLSLAIKIAKKRPDLNITIMTKARAQATSTQFAQGGIAVVIDKLNDSFDRHIADTLKAGGEACDPEIVQMVVRQAPERLRELIELGVMFDTGADGFHLALEGGHSRPRVLHHRDMTGSEIENALLVAVNALSNISLLENHFVIDLLVDADDRNRCVGAFYFDDKGLVKYIRAKATFLCTGGSGQIFGNTTNPEVATGDGIAIATRAGAEIRDMNFVQYHPTAMYEPGKNPCFLLSEALRGFGAHIVNHDCKRFLFKYDLRGELATRDVISRAISEELAKTGKKHVYLDCRHLDPAELQENFTHIVQTLKSKGIDATKQLIPIVPVAHYQCGGIATNKYGQTSVNGLFAIGECASTGLHGSNRLASNSLLEAAVFAHQAAAKILGMIDSISHSRKIYINKSIPGPVVKEAQQIVDIRSSLRIVMETFRAGGLLERAEDELDMLMELAGMMYTSGDMSPFMIETLNMLEVAKLVIEHSKSNNLIFNTQTK